MLGSRLVEKLGWLRRESSPGFLNSENTKNNELEAARLIESGYRLTSEGREVAALAQFKEALRLDPEAAEAYRGLGSIYLKQQSLDKAKTALLNAIRIRPHYADAHNDLGIIYDSLGNFRDAVKSYVQALRFQSNSAEVRNNLAMAYFNIGSYSEAIKAYQQTLSMHPSDTCAIYGLARVYMDLNDKESALDQHQRLLEIGENEIGAQLLDDIHRQVWQP